MILTKQQVDEIVKSAPAGYNHQIKKYHRDFYDMILQVPSGTKKFSEKLYRYFNPEISGKCLNPSCNGWRRFITYPCGYSSFCCKECAYESGLREEKAKETNMKKYGATNYTQTKQFRDNLKKKNQEKFGVDWITQSEYFKNKSKESKKEKYGDENYSNPEKGKQTKLEKYGDENYNNKEQNKKTKLEKYGDENFNNRERCRETKLERYGDENYCNGEKIKETLTERYGGAGFASKEITDKVRNTIKDKFGVEHPMKVQELKEKVQETKKVRYQNGNYDLAKMRANNKEKYGVEHPMQLPEIFDKWMKSASRYKEFTLPSGKIIEVQGYEPHALEILLELYGEDDIITGKSNMPEFWYINNGSKHRYYPDIFIKSENKFIEIKSDFTYESDKDRIELKCKAIKDSNYQIEVWIVFPKKKTIQKIQY